MIPVIKSAITNTPTEIRLDWIGAMKVMKNLHLYAVAVYLKIIKSQSNTRDKIFSNFNQ